MTYRKSSGGSLSFEGADFCAGRMTCGEVLYDVTDHLGSVRSAVVGSSGSAKTYAWYGAYGSRTLARVTVPPSPEPSYRYGFTGKEDQSTEFGIPYTDFGARHFSPDLGRWLTPDPLSEKYYGISPYAYCNGDPVNLVDPDGRDVWIMDENDNITWVQESDSHRLYTHDSEGNWSYVEINNRAFLDDLAGENARDGSVYYSSKESTASNLTDALSLFCFIADHSQFEWAVHYDDNQVSIGTKYSTDAAGNWNDYGFTSVPSTSIHSHPGIPEKEQVYSIGLVEENHKLTDKYYPNADYSNYMKTEKAEKYYVYFPVTKHALRIAKNRTTGKGYIYQLEGDLFKRYRKH